MARLFLPLFALLVMRAAGTGYRCVFLHGVGSAETSNATDSDTSNYWGGEDIVKHTPYCISRIFLHQDTVRRGWDDVDLQTAACELAVGDSSDRVIRDTVVISHSMGNLFFAEALRQGRCSLDISSSQWISIEAPWQGSKMASWIHMICSNQTSSKLLRWLAKELNYCDTENPGHVYQAYETLKPDFPGLEKLAGVANKLVSRALCGESTIGLASTYSAALAALAGEVRFGEASDAIVPLSSCKLPSRDYQNHYAAQFYVAEINHLDGTCRSGNGLTGNDSKKPCSWLELGATRAEQTMFV